MNNQKSVRQARREHGAAVAELAVILPVMTLMLLGAIDFARVYHTSICMNSAAYAGARYATHELTNSNNSGAIESKVMQNLENSAVTTPVEVDITNRCFCNENRTNEVACGAECPSSSLPPAVYVDVRVATPFDPIFAWPGLPDQMTVRGAAELRAS